MARRVIGDGLVDVGRRRVYFDDFNRADNTTIGLQWAETAGNISIVSNHIEGSGSRSDGIWVVPLWSSDMFVQTDQIGSSAGGSMYFRADRGSAAINNSYEVSWSSGSSGTILTRKFIAGSPSTINTTTGTGGAAGLTLRAEIVGQTISMFLNGVLKVCFTDTSIVTGQFCAVRTDGSTTAADNFVCGPL